MSLSVNPVDDEVDILATIRSKLSDARIQRSYWMDSQVFRSRGDGNRCRGCDRPIVRTDRSSVGYMSTGGERHWFHLLCDTVRQFVAANELKRERKPRGSAKRFPSRPRLGVLSDIGGGIDLPDELVEVARPT